jgi:hypothetical protein
MDFTEETTKAANILMSEATLDELRELAQDLRALAPDSALAELVEVKIEQISAEGGQDEWPPAVLGLVPQGLAQLDDINALPRITQIGSRGVERDRRFALHLSGSWCPS